MKIRDIQARAVVAPLEPPIRTASGHVTQAPLLLIDLATDSGVIGRSYLFGYHAFTLAPLRELVRALAEMIKGDEVAPVEIDKKLRARMALFGTRGLQGLAVAGIDMAEPLRRTRPAPNAPIERLRLAARAIRGYAMSRAMSAVSSPGSIGFGRCG